jgi:hypothetical protein
LTAGAAPDGVTITVAGPPPPQLVNNQFTAGVLVGVFVGVCVGVLVTVGVGVGVLVGHTPPCMTLTQVKQSNPVK